MRKIRIFLVIIILLNGFGFYHVIISKDLHNLIPDNNEIDIQGINGSALMAPEIVTNILSDKLTEFGLKGYFTQIYEPSLQATYYALYILDAIGRLHEIDTMQITAFIMSYYNRDENRFIDAYAQRFLDTNHSQYKEFYYPFSSFLEINCYAILALDLLNNIHLVNSVSLLNFIWSCYNSETSGFVGYPYNQSNPDLLKLSTLDNTYYAIRVIDLFDDWDSYPLRVTALQQHLLGLQSQGIDPSQLGGFFNDLYNTFPIDFRSISIEEPNILSDYYAIRCLQILNDLGSINELDFYFHLSGLYHDTTSRFSLTYTSGEPKYDLFATAIGIQLSSFTGYSDINYSAALKFIFNNRNQLGIWDVSTAIPNHELIHTFRIIRSMVELGEISRLDQPDRDLIAHTLDRFFNKNKKGYTLLSEDITSMNLLNVIINSFDLFGISLELPIAELYSAIENIYDEYYYIFYEFINMGSYPNLKLFSYPIEYKNYVLFNSDNDRSLRSIYLTLDSLQKIYKLEQFYINHGLTNLLNTILSCQISQVEHEKNGAFLPSPVYLYYSDEQKSTIVSFKNTYYAIKALELLDQYLGIYNLTGIGFNINSLKNFILSQMIETTSDLYFKEGNLNNVEDVLVITYYSLYILDKLDLHNLSDAKIGNYVMSHLNYSNIKNIYYTYKISELLRLNLNLDSNKIKDLISAIYSSFHGEFYLTIDQEIINQEILFWVCDLIQNFKITNGDSQKDNFEIDIMGSLPIIIFFTAGPLSIISLTSKKRRGFKTKKKVN